MGLDDVRPFNYRCEIFRPAEVKAPREASVLVLDLSIYRKIKISFLMRLGTIRHNRLACEGVGQISAA